MYAHTLSKSVEIFSVLQDKITGEINKYILDNIDPDPLQPIGVFGFLADSIMMYV